MSSPRKLKLLFTADLHWGIAKGMAANNALYEAIKENTPDVLVLAGDIGHAENFDVCLDKFASLNLHPENLNCCLPQTFIGELPREWLQIMRCMKP